MTTASTQLPIAISDYLASYQRRRDWQRIVRRCGLAIFLTVVWGAAWCFVDRMIALPARVRVAILLINAAAVIVILGRGVLRMIATADWVRIAREVERREPAWNERLATVTSRLLGPPRLTGSNELLGALAQDVSNVASQRDAAALLPWSPTFRPWIASAVVLGILCIAAITFPALDLPRLASRYASPLSDIAPAATTSLSVTPGDVKIAAGEALRVHANAQRLEEGGLTLHVRTEGQSAEDWTEQPMSAASDGTFEARVGNLERGIEYFVTGGDARSDIYHAIILHRPAILAFHWTINPPPYLQLPQRTLTNEDGSIEAPAGSDVDVQIEASEPLAAATIELGGESIITKPTERSNVRQAKLTIRDNRTIDLQMTSAANVQGEFSGGNVRAIVDRPPVVTLDADESEAASPSTIKYRAADDHGIARLDLEVQTPDGAQHVLPLQLHGNERDQRGALSIDPTIIGAKEGDELTLRLRGEDRAGQFALSSELHMQAQRQTSNVATPTPIEPETATTEPSTSGDATGFGDSLNAYFRAIAPR